MPRLKGHSAGAPLCPAEPVVADVSRAVASLDHSYVFVQGPPGAGKTYVGARVILDLLQQGCRVGVSSNSHKAIINLLREVEKAAAERGFHFAGCKKADANKPEEAHDGVCIATVADAAQALSGAYQLIAGTAWLFSDAAADQLLDYLFIDEAGQVSLGHLVAMGVAARNIVLLGDQMQLGQPIQGVHPGRSGESILEFLLEGRATVDPARGVFLADTWRMHPDVCSFISQAVYDGRLRSAAGRERQSLLVQPGAHPALRSTGLVFHAVEHEGNAQRSEEEADEIAALVESLLRQQWRNVDGVVQPVTLDDILVVAPYNLQVNLLRARLPQHARVGTIDKFQGQEAAVVIVSLATSSGEYLPRDIEFLYSKNRLNVSLSRARCLAMLVASPRLLDITCRTAEQIALVNTLCWAHEYAAALASRSRPAAQIALF